MTINLKQIRAIDSNNIKLDKINYNFDQLLVNGGGPKGPIGPDGNSGPQGFKGSQGVQGDRGSQGVQGPSAASAASFWSVVAQNLTLGGNNMATLFSKHPISGTTPIYGSIVGAGFIGGDNGYSIQQPNNGIPKYQWVVNRRRDKVAGNLRFTSDGVLGNAFDITMNNSVTNEYRLYLGFINNTKSQLNLHSKLHEIKSSTNGNLLFDISTISGNTYNNTFFEKPVKFNLALSINDSNANVNKIVTSVDNTGLITFKTTEELGGSVKIGTIISILPSIFKDSNNFISYQTVDTTVNPNVPLQIRIGAGIGNYAGWYICNGQEWTNGTIIGTAAVPDLNSFSYQIIANPITSDPNSQGYKNVINNDIQLMGGAPVYLDANETGISSAQYDISTTNNSNDPLVAINATGVQFKIKKLPQIIYIGATNLYWSQLGTGQLSLADYNSTDYNVTDYNAF